MRIYFSVTEQLQWLLYNNLMPLSDEHFSNKSEEMFWTFEPCNTKSSRLVKPLNAVEVISDNLVFLSRSICNVLKAEWFVNISPFSTSRASFLSIVKVTNFSRYLRFEKSPIFLPLLRYKSVMFELENIGIEEELKSDISSL